MFCQCKRCEVHGNAIVYPAATAENISRYRPGQTMRLFKNRPRLYMALDAKSHSSLLAYQQSTITHRSRYCAMRSGVVTYVLEKQVRTPLFPASATTPYLRNLVSLSRA